MDSFIVFCYHILLLLLLAMSSCKQAVTASTHAPALSIQVTAHDDVNILASLVEISHCAVSPNPTGHRRHRVPVTRATPSPAHTPEPRRPRGSGRRRRSVPSLWLFLGGMAETPAVVLGALNNLTLVAAAAESHAGEVRNEESLGVALAILVDLVLDDPWFFVKIVQV